MMGVFKEALPLLTVEKNIFKITRFFFIVNNEYYNKGLRIEKHDCRS